MFFSQGEKNQNDSGNSYNIAFADFLVKILRKVFEGSVGKLFSKSFPTRSPSTNQNLKI